jgi:hypothetical protein
VTKTIAFIGFGALIAVNAFIGLLAAPSATAVPGQCGYGNAGYGGGGFCDGAPWPDGSFYHCEAVYVLGFGGQNCYQACLDPNGHPFATDLDSRTPC